VLVPYERGDLVARAHKEGEVLSIEHTGDGTILHAHVPAGLYFELERTAKPVETV
jgi:GTP-binding protein HflX